MLKTASYIVGLASESVIVNAYGPTAERMIEFLCCDLLVDVSSVAPRAEYDLVTHGAGPVWSLWLGEDDVYTGISNYDLAYTLINEVLRQCICGNSIGCAIHAAAIGSTCGGVLLPGTSGSGKSTLTAWLVANGADYLTDELVVLADIDFQITPFTRPLSIKAGALTVLSTFVDISQVKEVVGRNGVMLPHRLINQNYQAITPPLSLVLFPQYLAGESTKISLITPAAGCAKLIECFVNARNIQGHGIEYIAQLARKIPMYELLYSSFDELPEQLNNAFPGVFLKSESNV